MTIVIINITFECHTNILSVKEIIEIYDDNKAKGKGICFLLFEHCSLQFAIHLRFDLKCQKYPCLKRIAVLWENLQKNFLKVFLSFLFVYSLYKC